MLPNFLIIGAPKAGTTSLCYYLSQHPEIFISQPKETHFFCDDSLYSKGIEFYERFFSGSEGHRLRGEGTPFYAMHRTFPEVLSRIYDQLPDLKLVYMVRHPIQRMESYYSQEVHNGWQVPDFNTAIRQRPHYIDGSLYNEQFQLYQDAYGAERIHVEFFEDFCDAPHDSLQRVLEFLGVAPDAWSGDLTPQNQRSNHLRDTSAMQVLRRVPGFRMLERHRNLLLPQRLRTQLKNMLRRPVTTVPAWHEDVRRWAVDQIAEDSRQFLERMGKPSDFWNLTPSVSDKR